MQDLEERTQVMELIQALTDEQVRYILRIIQALPHQEQSEPRCNLRGRFSHYANPELRAREKEAWGLAAGEKHGLC